MFGGSLVTAGALGATNDTWELAATDAPTINEQPASQIRLAGEHATFNVSAVGHGFVAYQWYFQNNLIVGAQSDTLTIPSVGEATVGRYYVRVGSQCGSVTSRVATLTLNRNLQLLSAPGTIALLWSPNMNDTNVFLETADHLTGPWTIVPNPTIPFPVTPAGPAKFYRYRKPD